MTKIIGLTFTHLVALVIGVGIGIYSLPILVAEDGPTQASLVMAKRTAKYEAQFSPQRADSDFLHWGDASVFVGPHWIAWQGHLAPGPRYRLYVSRQFIETEADFQQARGEMVDLGPVSSFGDYVVPVPEELDIEEFSTLVVWCESFSQFITSAQYKTHR